MKTTDLSFVFPCLNEEETISFCINEVKSVLKKMNISYEIIVSDNGSSDKSREIAQSLGARVVLTEKKGYGEALKNGFTQAKGTYVAFADIDGSYPISFLPSMFEKIKKEDADMIVASRMTGVIEKNAMPFLHRYLGTPVLTKIINLLFKEKLSDCNSGFRIFKKKSYEQWGVVSGGMEFASELLIKALKNKAKIVEISAGLRVDKRTKKPHLQTWRDGMRHLLFILSESPQLFEKVGFYGLAGALFVQTLAVTVKPVKFGVFSIFDYHSQIVCLIIATLCLQSWIFAMMLYVCKRKEKPLKISQFLISISEGNLFFLLLLTCFVVFIGFIFLFIQWAAMNFENLNMLYYLIYFLYIVILFGGGIFGLLNIHILKRIL